MDNKEQYKISINNIYEGPMDLLLALIKREKIDIYDIPISYLTDEFLKVMGEINFKNVESYLEFSEMAATLLQIKSRTLLPKTDLDIEEEDPRTDLVNRIIEYNYYRSISEVLEQYYNIGSSRILKKSEDITQFSKDEEIDYKDLDISRLARTLSKILRKNVYEDIDIDMHIEEEKFTIEESLQRLRTKLMAGKSLSFLSLFSNKTSKMEIVTYFLAILELSKNGLIYINQISDEDIIIARI